MQYAFSLAVGFFAAAAFSTALNADGRKPMALDRSQSEIAHFSNKLVEAARPIVNLANDQRWQTIGHGEFQRARGPDDGPAVAFTTPEVVVQQRSGDWYRGAFGTAGLRLKVPQEDWGDYQRISFYAYAEPNGEPVVNLTTRLDNENKQVSYPATGFPNQHFAVLKPGTWTHVVWELGDTPRDKVTALKFVFEIRGKMLKESGDQSTIWIADLELQRAHPKHVQGWQVKDRLVYSQTGYGAAGPKRALVPASEPKAFTLHKNESDTILLEGQTKTLQTELGKYQALDLTKVTRPGQYVLKVAGRKPRTITIAQKPWKTAVKKSLNALYVQRCGATIPGHHTACHKDVFVKRNGKRIHLNGGWHDAADLTKKTGHTAEMTYAMARFAQRLRKRNAEAGTALVSFQQSSYLEGPEKRLAGFFRDSPKSDRPIWSGHFGIEHQPVVALSRLC